MLFLLVVGDEHHQQQYGDRNQRQSAVIENLA
jgi:hypothetical protein